MKRCTSRLSLAGLVGCDHELVAIGCSRHFQAEITKSSDRNQKHQSMRSVLAFRVYEGKDRDKFALDLFFEAYGYALDKYAQDGFCLRSEVTDYSV
jgi:hypothetical protein